MSRRAVWKGTLAFGRIHFGVGLYSALSSAEKLSFHIVNRKSGHRVERQYIDSETGKPVDREDQIRGYELDTGDYVMVEDEALKQLMPESDKRLAVKSFIACDEIDKLYFDKPYYLAPADDSDEEAFNQFGQALKDQQVAAFAEAVLFRRNRALLIRPHGRSLVATTLNYDYEVRSARNAFKSLPEPSFDEELLELATHIIDTRMGEFDPNDYGDRYNTALMKLVADKLAGKAIKPRKREEEGNVIDLREALRRSAGEKDKGKSSKPARNKRQKDSAGSRRKAS